MSGISSDTVFLLLSLVLLATAHLLTALGRK